MKHEVRPSFLRAVKAKGCDTQVGTDMLLEQIPASSEFFGFPTTTAWMSATSRGSARITY